MTVSTGTAVSTGTIIMDLAGTYKRSGNRIRSGAARDCVMTTVTGRICTRDFGAMVNSCLSYSMDSFPTVSCRRMTGGTRRRVPLINIRLGQQGGSVQT